MRRHSRFKIKLPLILRHSGRFIMAEAINVSECGMLVNADDSDISSESMVEVVFDISGRRDLSAMARIRHLERTDVSASFGIQFLTPFSDGVRAVRSYCASSSV